MKKTICDFCEVDFSEGTKSLCMEGVSGDRIRVLLSVEVIKLHYSNDPSRSINPIHERKDMCWNCVANLLVLSLQKKDVA